jgi:DNA-binding beta-propeller fold protein YncE
MTRKLSLRRPGRFSQRVWFLTGIVLFAAAVAGAQQAGSPKYTLKPLPLPSASGLVVLDYFSYDKESSQLWVPASNTGRVDVIDGFSDQIRSVEGFTVAPVEFRGRQLLIGPSSVAVGRGVVYVGSRADSKICAIESTSLKLGRCISFAPVSAGMAAAPDGLIYIAATRELWVTSGAPPIGIPAADPSMKIFSAEEPGHLVPAGRIPLTGSAEGYAVDNAHGLFFTNLEETGETVAIDVRKRSVVSKWRSCDGPSGVAVDSKRGFVFVACTDHVLVLDGRHDGKVLGSLPSGAGVDNIDYCDEDGLLYVAAAEAAQLTIARIGDDGKPAPGVVVPTVKGARSVVAGSKGSAYLIDPAGGRILKVQPQ